jgi:hypothetical protein
VKEKRAQRAYEVAMDRARTSAANEEWEKVPFDENGWTVRAGSWNAGVNPESARSRQSAFVSGGHPDPSTQQTLRKTARQLRVR